MVENRWIKKLRERAETGDASAQFDLADIYASGNFVPKDFPKALKYYRKSAQAGHAEAQYNLAGIYYDGHGGVPQSYVKAVKWLRKAAEARYAPAQFALGWMYKKGYGVRQDDAEAEEWYRIGEETEKQQLRR